MTQKKRFVHFAERDSKFGKMIRTSHCYTLSEVAQQMLGILRLGHYLRLRL